MDICGMNHHGFTLMEILIAVITVAVLTTIALPQYQKAVTKSSYHSLFSIAQAIHTGQEHFYLTNNHYANELSELDVSAQSNPLEDASIRLHNDESNNYTLLTRNGLNNTLVVYNSHSPSNPDSVLCEAEQENTIATWLCETAMHGTPVESGSITPGYVAYALTGSADSLQEIEEIVHEPVAYENTSGDSEESLILEEGDSCTATQTQSCQFVDAHGAECIADGKQACAYSNFEDGSTCTSSGENGCSHSEYTAESTCQATGANGGCANSSYDDESSCSTINGGKQGCAFSEYANNSTCTAGQEGGTGTKPLAGCHQSIFTEGSTCVVNQNTANNAGDTACGGNGNGGKADTTGANSAQYYGSECINESTNSFGCGRSWYKEGSTCTSSRTNGGCGNSLFDASHCVGRGGNACDKSKFTNGAVCEAWASGTCPITQSTYDATSYCAGKDDSRYSYCPAGTPAPPATPGGLTTGRTWRACTSDDGAPKSGMSCYDD